MSYHPVNTTELSGWADDIFSFAYDDSTRPNPYYVRVGDVVRVQLYLGAPYVIPYGDTEWRDFQAACNSNGLQVVYSNFTSGGVFGNSSITIDVQPLRSDFANVSDVANLVAGIAYNVGYDINEAQGVIKTQNNTRTVPNRAPALPNTAPDTGIVQQINDAVNRAVTGVSNTAYDAAASAGKTAEEIAKESAKAAMMGALLYGALALVGVVIFFKMSD